MKKITEALRSRELATKDLPQEVQDQIKELSETIKSYNAALEAYEENQKAEDAEPDEETEKKLDDLEDSISEKEIELATFIKAYEKPATEPSPAAPAPAAQAQPKKEDNSVGWLVFGGVVLALTLGAVNLMKKK
jgi:septal ring factor EnvC (AmiA/AmiB activator)